MAGLSVFFVLVTWPQLLVCGGGIAFVVSAYPDED